MATSKSRSEDDKASLVVLPVELLGEIVDRIGWESLDRLWQCGSRVLNSKLSNPNCVKCLSNKNEHGVIGPWEEATIRRFQAIRCFALDLPSNSHFQLSVSFLQSLPSTLRELAIRKSDGVSRTSSSMKKANISPTILLDLFPQLESLSVYCAELKQDLLSNCRKFPSGLTHLYIDVLPVPARIPSLIGDFLSDLPLGLRTLELMYTMVPCSFDWVLRLSHLESLTIAQLGAMTENPTSDKIGKLSSLTTCKIFTTSFLISQNSQDERLMSSLTQHFPNLTNLEIPTVVEASLKFPTFRTRSDFPYLQ
jgi:hypothetical protein